MPQRSVRALICLLVMILSVAYVLVEMYCTAPLLEEAFWVTLQCLPRLARATLCLAGGVTVLAWGLRNLTRSMRLARTAG